MHAEHALNVQALTLARLQAYDLHVRHLFVLLMMVLLPVRAWAGDHMVIQMATRAAEAQVAGTMPPDCPMHLQAGADAPDHDRSDMPAGMEGCGSCDLCIPLA